MVLEQGFLWSSVVGVEAGAVKNIIPVAALLFFFSPGVELFADSSSA